MLTETRLAYHRTGAGEPLVLLHGASNSNSDDLGVAGFHVAGSSLGGRVALELASRGRVRSVVAIAPDGLGTPAERMYQAAALLTGRALATLLAPVAAPPIASRVGRSVFFATERSRPWRLPADDAHRLLVSFATSAGYLKTVRAALVDVPPGLDRLTCPVLLQGTADPLVSGQAPVSRRRAARKAAVASRPEPRPDLRRPGTGRPAHPPVRRRRRTRPQQRWGFDRRRF